MEPASFTLSDAGFLFGLTSATDSYSLRTTLNLRRSAQLVAHMYDRQSVSFFERSVVFVDRRGLTVLAFSATRMRMSEARRRLTVFRNNAKMY
jgi:hypothetical protein